jgi:hypothetical protein
MGSFNKTRTTLRHAFKEDDRIRKEFEQWEWERRRSGSSNETKSKLPVSVERTADGRRIKRSSDDGIEKVYIAGWSIVPVPANRDCTFKIYTPGKPYE